MPLVIERRIREGLGASITESWNIPSPEVVLNQAPKIELGELATPVAMGLAKTLGIPPRTVAEQLIRGLAIDGVRNITVAGPGYINFHLDRTAVVRALATDLQHARFEAFPPQTGKIIVEHTNINPNKAAHIGHLRNAAIGDTFARILKFAGHNVEIQNYIDNTGVQVADVIVGFIYIEHRSLEAVRALIEDPAVPFDYYCWDLYAQVSSYYATEDPTFTKRAETLKAIEDSKSETAEMAEAVAMAIVGCHLKTMHRIGIHYDVLPRESDILHLKFWQTAFDLLRQREAVFLEREGKNQGCWVMRLDSDRGREDKIIVRSNGTVTYVGKDIAYQLWKLGLLEMDFHYRILESASGAPVWVTTASDGEATHPHFGRGTAVYNVIDVRQSYPQVVVREGVRALGHERAAEQCIHFSYEMVALTPACAEQLGIELSEEDRRKPYVEVSGRKGQGVKADDLLNTLEKKALFEVQKRHPDAETGEQVQVAHEIAVGALRYFLLRFTRNTVIAFDFDEALSFDGETGPYIQYAVVRANNIFRRAEDAGLPSSANLVERKADERLSEFLCGNNDIWELVYAASRLDEVVSQITSTMEPSTLAKFAFNVAQRFNLFYHSYRVLSEPDPERRDCYLLVVDLVRKSLSRALELLGIAVPARM